MKKDIVASCAKEQKYIAQKEAAFQREAEKDPPQWKTALTEKVPEKIADGLRSAFARGFALVFEKGTAVIGKTYDKEELADNYLVQDYAVQLKGSRRELKRMRKMTAKSNGLNTAIAAAEGTALGILGIGMPDIVVFLGILLKGAYESTVQFGFDYEDPREKRLILKMMEAALSKKEDWVRANAEVDRLLTETASPGEDEIREQIRRTADRFAMDMLVLKFVQGLPVVGILGGMANPVYYSRIMKYVQLKYYKRYIDSLCARAEGKRESGGE